jgi:hypothetical protein
VAYDNFRSASKQGKNAMSQHLRHVVLFQFKAGTTAEQVRTIEEAFSALPDQIDTIRDFEWGTDVSVEGKADGFTHCFFVTFGSAADRDAYLPHPAHRAFGTLLRPHLEKVLVFDYWATNA